MIQQESSVFEKLQDQVGFGIVGCLQADMVHLQAEQLANLQPTMVENSPLCVVTSSPLFAQEVISINPVQDKVEQEFENGVRDVVDLVVGADGIHSPMAKIMIIDN
jgi:hypothetical protein